MVIEKTIKTIGLEPQPLAIKLIIVYKNKTLLLGTQEAAF